MINFITVVDDIRYHATGNFKEVNVVSGNSLYIFKYDHQDQRWILSFGAHGGLPPNQKRIDAIRSKLTTFSYSTN